MLKCGLSTYRGLWMNYSVVNWEGSRVTRSGCRYTVAVNPPSQRQHTCNLSDLTAADRVRGVGGGSRRSKEAERWQIGRKEKGN